jgi:hypothetical protein
MTLRLITTFIGWETSIPHETLHDVDVIDSNDVFHVYDAFQTAALDRFWPQRGRAGYVVNDLWSAIEWPGGPPVYTCPAWLVQQIRMFRQDRIPLIDSVTTEYACNFMINKKQVNRYLMLKLQEMFDLDCTYSYSGKFRGYDMSTIIQELESLDWQDMMTQRQRGFLLAPVELPQRWIEYTGEMPPENPDKDKDDPLSWKYYGGNTWSWVNGLHDIFEKSAISLITESVAYDRGAVFTEKTAFSVMGLTLPIWVGGYGQAAEWEKLGFDIFDDVIDHSYQYRDTLFERCWWAVKSNLDLLRDRERAAQLRSSMMPRLLANRDLLMSDHVRDRCWDMVESWPQEIRDTGGALIKAVYLAPENQ